MSITEHDLQRLIDGRAVEGPALEFKRQLDIRTRGEKAEALKDLTGMANGGGGRIVYGVNEDDDGRAQELVPLTDHQLPAILEDVIRSGVRPRLHYEFTEVDVEGGFVLDVTVGPSSLGPYMVDAYKEQRYFIRHGRSTEPMREREVRDFYALATRGRDELSQRWADHRLPHRPAGSGVWLVTSAMPHRALVELPMDAKDRAPGGTSAGVHESEAAVASAGRSRWWANGLVAESSTQTGSPRVGWQLRNDGAAAIYLSLPRTALPYEVVLRAISGQLSYLARLWSEFDVRGPTDTDLGIIGLSVERSEDSEGEIASIAWPGSFGVRDTRPLTHPADTPAPTIDTRSEWTAEHLQRASGRHKVVAIFAGRLLRAYDIATWEPLGFTDGWLHTPAGDTNLVLRDQRIHDQVGNLVAYVHDDTSVRPLNDATTVVAWAGEGVLLDPAGDALAATEFCLDHRLPDTTTWERVRPDMRYPGPATDAGATPDSAPCGKEPPASTGRWAGRRATPADVHALVRGSDPAS